MIFKPILDLCHLLTSQFNGSGIRNHTVQNISRQTDTVRYWHFKYFVKKDAHIDIRIIRSVN